MRKKLLDSLPEFDSEDGQIITKNYKFELITPMFGGDSKSWDLNLEAPVRAQSIKGQLRFWWRTMQNETDSSRLLELENALWGGKSGKDRDGNDVRRKSEVRLEVQQQKVAGSEIAKLNDKETMLEDGAIPAYVAFPVRDLVKKRQEVRYITKASFKLRISFHEDYEPVVLKTLKLWTLFSGVGARTRRGCGSLYCEKLLREFSSQTDVANFIAKLGNADTGPVSYCRMSGALLACSSFPSNFSPAESWVQMIELYNIFRQDRDGKFGRSNWPEPDAIRRLTETPVERLSDHPDGVWFPRAGFGLPIITQFKTDGNGKGDPEDVQLTPINGNRWPSPVIIKVIKLSSCLLKVVLVLNQSFPDGLKLEYSKKSDREKLPKITDIPSTAHPANLAGKVMRTNEPLNGDSIYKALFDALGVNEI